MKLPILCHSPDPDLNKQFIKLLSEQSKKNLTLESLSSFDSPFIGHKPFYSLFFAKLNDEFTQETIESFTDLVDESFPDNNFKIILIPYDKLDSPCAPEKNHKIIFEKIENLNILMKYDENFKSILDEAFDKAQECYNYRKLKASDYYFDEQNEEIFINNTINSLILSKLEGDNEFSQALTKITENTIKSIDELESLPSSTLFYCTELEIEEMLGLIYEREDERNHFLIISAKESPILNFEIDDIISNSSYMQNIVRCEEFFEAVNCEQVTIIDLLSYLLCLSINCESIALDEIFLLFEYLNKKLLELEQYSCWKYYATCLLLKQRITPVFTLRLEYQLILSLVDMKTKLNFNNFDENAEKFEKLIDNHPDKDVKNAVSINSITFRQYFEMFTRFELSYYFETIDLYELMVNEEKLLSICDEELDLIIEELNRCPEIELDLLKGLLQIENEGYVQHNCKVLRIMETCCKQVEKNDIITQNCLAQVIEDIFTNTLYCKVCKDTVEELGVYYYLFKPTDDTKEVMIKENLLRIQHFDASVELEKHTSINNVHFKNSTSYLSKKIRVEHSTNDENKVLCYDIENPEKFKYIEISFVHSSFQNVLRQHFESEITDDKEIMFDFVLASQEIDEIYVLDTISLSYDKNTWFDFKTFSLSKPIILEVLNSLMDKEDTSEYEIRETYLVHTIPMQHHFAAKLLNNFLLEDTRQNIYIEIHQNVNMKLTICVQTDYQIELWDKISVIETGRILEQGEINSEYEQFTLKIPALSRNKESVIHLVVKSLEKEQDFEIPLAFFKLFIVQMNLTNKYISLEYELVFDVEEIMQENNRLSLFDKRQEEEDNKYKISFKVNDNEVSKELELKPHIIYCIAEEISEIRDFQFEFMVQMFNFEFLLSEFIIFDSYVQILRRPLRTLQLQKYYTLEYNIINESMDEKKFILDADNFYISGPEAVIIEKQSELNVQLQILPERTGQFYFPGYYCLEEANMQYSGFEINHSFGKISVGDEVVTLELKSEKLIL